MTELVEPSTLLAVLKRVISIVMSGHSGWISSCCLILGCGRTLSIASYCHMDEYTDTVVASVTGLFCHWLKHETSTYPFKCAFIWRRQTRPDFFTPNLFFLSAPSCLALTGSSWEHLFSNKRKKVLQQTPAPATYTSLLKKPTQFSQLLKEVKA